MHRTHRPLATALIAVLALLGVLVTTAGPATSQSDDEAGGESLLQDFPDLPAVDIQEPGTIAQGAPGIDPEVAEAAEAGGTVDVMVQLDVATQVEAELPASEVVEQQQELSTAATEAVDAVDAVGGEVQRTYDTVPWVAATVPADELDALLADPAVRRVALNDQISAADVASSLPLPGGVLPLLTSENLIDAPEAWAAGYQGQGRSVAIVDTGILSGHPFLAGRVSTGACFSSNGTGVEGGCPNGQLTQTGSVAAGAPCTFNDTRCDHGTHVAAIAGGNAVPAQLNTNGVAPEASLIAVRAAGRVIANNNETFLFSDLVAGLQWLYNNRVAFNLAAVNMSLGGGGPFLAACTSSPLEASIAQLRGAGIPVAVATGNDGFTTGVSNPACIAEATAVGNSRKNNDTVHPSSNAGPGRTVSGTFYDAVDLMAPGSGADPSNNPCSDGIYAASFGAGLTANYECKQGTSMATPHVAGAFALIDQKVPSATVLQQEAALIRGGVGITDTGTNPDITVSRINVDDALRIHFRDALYGHPFWEEITWLAYYEITTGFNGGLDFQPGSPVTRQAMSAFLYRLAGEPSFTPPGTPSFPDVSLSHPFFDEIEWLAGTGITGGYEDGTFRPGGQVTRQAMSAFMYRFVGEPPLAPNPPTFSDVGPGHPFRTPISWMAQEGVSTGYSDGTFRPADNVSRQAMAAFMFRLPPA